MKNLKIGLVAIALIVGTASAFASKSTTAKLPTCGAAGTEQCTAQGGNCCIFNNVVFDKPINQ
jgi:hypothetical protein